MNALIWSVLGDLVLRVIMCHQMPLLHDNFVSKHKQYQIEYLNAQWCA